MSLPSLLNFDIKPPPEKVSQMVIEEKEEPVNEETGEENPNFIYDTIEKDEVSEIQETIDLEFVKKPEIDEHEIFANKPPRKMGQPTRSTSPKKKVKRKPLSEEDKEKRREALARGRETRARNLAKKKALEEQEEELQNEEKELELENKELDLEIKNAKLNKKTKKVRQVIIEDSSSEEEEIQYVKRSKKKKAPQPHTMIVKDTQMRQSITQEDIERSQLNTLLAYERMRKDRKAEKKRVAQIEEQQQQIKQTMKQVNNQWGRGAGKYSSMLSGMGL